MAELNREPGGTYGVVDLEIFATGTHNGDPYTEDDLDQIVKAHHAVGHEIRPFLKLGHDEEQQLLQKDGYPAAGWFANIRRKGVKLIADLTNVPRKIAELIKQKAYGRLSSEIYLDLDHKGTKYPKVLKAVALLGGDTPAVKTLDDFLALYGSASVPMAYVEKGATLRAYEGKWVSFPADIDACVTALQGKPGVNNPWALCNFLKSSGKGMFATDWDGETREYLSWLAEHQTEEARTMADDEKTKKLEAERDSLREEIAGLKKLVEELQKKQTEESTSVLVKAAELKAVEAEKKAAALQAKVDEVEKAKAELHAETQRILEEAEVNKMLEAAVRAGRIAPVNVARLKALASLEHMKANEKGERVAKYTATENGKTTEKELTFTSSKTLVLDLVRELPQLAEFAEMVPGRTSKPSLKPSGAPEDAMLEEVEKVIADAQAAGRTLRYSEAVKIVAAQHQEG